MNSSKTRRFNFEDLKRFSVALLNATGVDDEKSTVISEVLIEGDLLGHSTHGLQLLAPYLSDIEKGLMKKTGQPIVISDLPAAVAWDGDRLPGTWLTAKAIDLASDRAKKFGACSLTIARGHHIACLAAYLTRATDQGLVIIIMSSAPENSSVAPYGAKSGVITPNPIAAGWPTSGDPVLIDVSTSITTNGMVGRLKNENGKLAGDWLINSNGQPTNDPHSINGSLGALLPIGGIQYGHKGYALGLLVEALTQGLSGHGRADPVEGWTGEVFLQVFDPRMFGGVENFLRQTSWVSNACKQADPIDANDPVRLPGERGLKLKREQIKSGIALRDSIVSPLLDWARKLGVEPPKTIDER